MFAFEIWGKFASFRDPFTISQNISLPIPPKTTVAGMMASILGVENYFDDDVARRNNQLTYFLL
jgi:CRISPR-associated protein Cas5h